MHTARGTHCAFDVKLIETASPSMFNLHWTLDNRT